jgi:hypothetical protein
MDNGFRAGVRSRFLTMMRRKMGIPHQAIELIERLNGSAGRKQ